MSTPPETSGGPAESTDRPPVAKKRKVTRRRGAAKRSEPQPGSSSEWPSEGSPVCMKKVKRAGPYLLGPAIGHSPLRSIVQCLARHETTDKFYTLKILTLKRSTEETRYDYQDKVLLHTEYSLLSLLHDQDNVIHHHGFFKDQAVEERSGHDKKLVYTGRIVDRLCLVLDCLVAHDYSPETADLIDLQHYVIRENKLRERETALILYNTVKVVKSLHERNIVHRDLKLANLILHQSTHKVTITNFCLGKLLVTENDLIRDHRGAPAYISPDGLCGKPYLGKPSDMWAIGVILYTLLYGQFPFYDSSPTQLFKRIKTGAYSIPEDSRTSDRMVSLIKNLLVVNPVARFSAEQTVDELSTIFACTTNLVTSAEPLQVVPAMSGGGEGQEVGKKESNEMDKEGSSDYFCNNSIKIASIAADTRIHPPQERRTGQIPVHRVGEDARQITQSELARFRHLLPLNVRVEAAASMDTQPPPPPQQSVATTTTTSVVGSLRPRSSSTSAASTSTSANGHGSGGSSAALSPRTRSLVENLRLYIRRYENLVFALTILVGLLNALVKFPLAKAHHVAPRKNATLPDVNWSLQAHAPLSERLVVNLVSIRRARRQLQRTVETPSWLPGGGRGGGGRRRQWRTDGRWRNSLERPRGGTNSRTEYRRMDQSWRRVKRNSSSPPNKRGDSRRRGPTTKRKKRGNKGGNQKKNGRPKNKKPGSVNEKDAASKNDRNARKRKSSNQNSATGSKKRSKSQKSSRKGEKEDKSPNNKKKRATKSPSKKKDKDESNENPGKKSNQKRDNKEKKATTKKKNADSAGKKKKNRKSGESDEESEGKSSQKKDSGQMKGKKKNDDDEDQKDVKKESSSSTKKRSRQKKKKGKDNSSSSEVDSSKSSVKSNGWGRGKTSRNSHRYRPWGHPFQASSLGQSALRSPLYYDRDGRVIGGGSFAGSLAQVGNVAATDLRGGLAVAGI